MCIAEAAHKGATPTVDDKGMLQCLECEFIANAADTPSFDEYIASVRCCASGVDDVNIDKCDDCIITA